MRAPALAYAAVQLPKSKTKTDYLEKENTMSNPEAQACMMSTIFAGRKPYNAAEYAAKTIEFLMFDDTVRTFRAGDYSAYYNNLTFRQESRAASHLSEMESRLKEIQHAAQKYYEAVPDQAQNIRSAADKSCAKHIAFTLDYMAYHSGMASAGIVGPSNFPASRERKKQDRAFARYERLKDHVKLSAKRFKKIAYPHGNPSEAIRSNHPDAIRLITKQIERLEARHVLMKQVNADTHKAVKKDDPQAFLAGLGYSAEEVAKYLKRDYMDKIKPYTYHLSNNKQNITRLKRRLETLTVIKSAESREDLFDLPNGETLRVIRNTETIRIQLFFQSKPNSDIRTLVKRYGFKWSPKANAWQRMLNANGFTQTKQLLICLEAKAKKAKA